MPLTFSDFEPWLAPELQGVPLFSIKSHLSAVISEFCQRSKCVTISIVKNLAIDGSVFPEEVGSDQTIFELEKAKVDGMSIALFNEFDSADRTSIKIDDAKTGFEVVNPKKGKQLKVLFTISSKRNATEYPDELERWIDGIVSGVLARLMLTTGKPWSNNAQGSFHTAQYSQAITKARARAIVAQYDGSFKLQPIPFI